MSSKEEQDKMESDYEKHEQDKRQLGCLKSIAENLNGFRKEGIHTDVTLVVDGKEFPCHKVVLAAASPYFNAMFNSGMKESVQSSIELKDVNHDTFEHLLEYAYNGKMDISEDNFEEMFIVADLFQFERLKAECYDFLDTVAWDDLENSLRYLVFALTYNLEHFLEYHWQRVADGFGRYAESCSDELLKALDEHTLIKVLQLDRLDAKNEDAVYKFVTRWVKADVKRRFERIIPYIRLAFCTEEFLKNVVSKDAQMKNTACRKALKEARKLRNVPGAVEHEIATSVSQRREGYTKSRKLFIAGGTEVLEDNITDTNDEVYNVGIRHPTYEWSQCSIEEDLDTTLILDYVNFQVHQSAVCVTEGKYGPRVLLTGGVTSGAFIVDTSVALWVEEGPPAETVKGFSSPMTQERHLHSAVLIDPILYIFGGRTNTGITNKCEKLNLIGEPGVAYEPISDMPVAAWSTMSVLFDNKVYILGGSSDPGILAANQIYNTRRNTWTLKADMPTACCDAAAVRYNDNIFVVGGRDRVCMRYTPNTDTWSKLKGPEFQHGHAPAVVWCGKILVGGGLVDSPESGTVADPEPWDEPSYLHIKLKASNKMEEYDPAQNQWIEWSTRLPKKLYRHHFSNIPWEYAE